MATARSDTSIKKNNQSLHEYLTGLNVIEQTALDAHLQLATEKNTLLEDVLSDADILSQKILGKFLADFHQMSFVYLAETSIDEEVLQYLPKEFAFAQQAILFSKTKQEAKLAITNVVNAKKIRELVQRKVGVPVKAYYATKRDLGDALLAYNQDVSSVFKKIIDDYSKQAEDGGSAEAPIVKIVETIITYAYQSKSSDIHIEPTDDYSLVRFRIDGILHDIVRLPRDLHDQIVTRIKVMAHMRTDEHQTSQDSKLVFDTKEEELDLRVSIVPITTGENIVMRLLSERSRKTSLSELGIVGNDLQKITDAYSKPHGMILSTGPTGSGKTTTLYSILKQLNRRDINIMTIEDPVEYNIENINQIQVNTKTDLSFAKGLRSIVRQDPDIVLVGEIRDEETAGIAVNAAMTGHLVLSTLHTNDAATTFPRLADMGVEEYLVASSVSVVVAQRLVRKICVACRISTSIHVETLTADIRKRFDGQKTVRAYVGKGCPVCHQTGYQGRIGLFEVLVVDEDIKQAVINNQNASQIKKKAIENGMTTMLQDGINKVQQGITTFDEVMRVTSE